MQRLCTNMTENKTIYKLIGFYENFGGSGKLKLKLANANGSICCYIEDLKFIYKYLSNEDIKFINKRLKMNKQFYGVYQ
jgi:hypothetical protein